MKTAQVPQAVEAPQAIAVPLADSPQSSTAPMKVVELTSEGRVMSEDDLMRLKKINFKKKVSGKNDTNYILCLTTAKLFFLGKEKRLRQNRKLYRMLTPRNAIAALNELHGQSVNESVVIPTQGNKFEAEITINNVRYSGVGNSKMQAKNAASEKALRDLVITKFQQIKNHDTSTTVTDSAVTDDVSIEDDKTEDVPMLQLASFALHKLFAEWEAEGFEIPLPKTTVSSLYS